MDDIEDPKDWCRDISGKGKWGNGEVEFVVEKQDDIEYAMFLINQSFEEQNEETVI